MKRILHDKRGMGEAVSFLAASALLLLIFVSLFYGLVYVMNTYNASYMCRKITRQVEITGVYDDTVATDLLNEMDNGNLSNLEVSCDASYFSDNKIQLRDSFSIAVSADYQMPIARFGDTPITITLPITVEVVGLSEVFWK